MLKIIDSISSFFSNYSQIIMIVFFLFIFVLIGVYFYKKYATPKFNQNFTNVANENQLNVPNVDMFFFYADWCPHCTKAKPEWTSFSDEYHETIVNNHKIMCHSVDCTDNGKDNNGEDTPLVLELMNKYEVKSFPTLKVRMDDNTIDFDSKITKASLDKFVKSVVSND